MFYRTSEVTEIPVGGLIRIGGSAGRLLSVDGTIIKIVFLGLAYSELVWIENERWYNTKEPSPRARIVDMDKFFIEDNKLYFRDVKAVVSRTSVTIDLPTGPTQMRVITQTCIDLIWDDAGQDVESMFLGETLAWPCLLMVNDKGQAYYMVYGTDGDYEGIDLYTNIDGQFTQLDINWNSNWSFVD